MTPQQILARAMGWETPAGGRGVPTEGPCRWCGTTGPLGSPIPVTFTQWDRIGVSPSEPWLCGDCGGALTSLKPIRWGHAQIRTDGDAEMSTNPVDLYQWLSTPVRGNRCVLVQTNRQKRSVVNAAWGIVATTYDTPGLPWQTEDTTRMKSYNRLRWHHSVSEREITEPAPRSSTLAGSPDPAELLNLWHHVKTVDPVRLEIIMLATRRTKPKPA